MIWIYTFSNFIEYFPSVNCTAGFFIFFLFFPSWKKHRAGKELAKQRNLNCNASLTSQQSRDRVIHRIVHDCTSFVMCVQATSILWGSRLMSAKSAVANTNIPVTRYDSNIHDNTLLRKWFTQFNGTRWAETTGSAAYQQSRVYRHLELYKYYSTCDVLLAPRLSSVNYIQLVAAVNSNLVDIDTFRHLVGGTLCSIRVGDNSYRCNQWFV